MASRPIFLCGKELFCMEQSYYNPFGIAVSGREAPQSAPSEQEFPSPPISMEPVIPLPNQTPEVSDGQPAESNEEPTMPPSAEGEMETPEIGQTPPAVMPFPSEGGDLRDPSLAHVRFLHALTEGVPMRVILENRLLTPQLSPGNLTGCFPVRPGFQTLALFNARSPSPLLYFASIPFSPGEMVTLAIVRRANNGVDLVRVDDRACYMRGTERACVRAVNLVYNSPALDVMLTDGRAVFTDVRFKETTSCRRAKAGQYDMYIARTPYVLPTAFTDIETVEDLPVAAANYFLPGFGRVEPLASFGLEARAGATETIYLMGNWELSRNIRARVVENY